MRVLVVEDEPALANSLRRALGEEDFAVDLAADGDEGLYRILHVNYDAVVLDVMLPKIDGWTVLQKARAQKVRTPILILTALDQVQDRVRGLNLGADDYLAKPFATTELVARLHALIRRAYGDNNPAITVGDITIDAAARRVLRGGVAIELTPREYAILEFLIRSRGRLVTRATLTEHVYSEDAAVASNVLDVHIAALRRKLGTDIIRTRRGEGYIVDA